MKVSPSRSSSISQEEPELLPHAPDYALIIITLALLCVGLVMVYSASLVASYAQHGNQDYFFLRQLMWCGLGVAVMVMIARVPYRAWRKLSALGLVVSVVLLVAVLLPGLGGSALGATRWIRIHGVEIGQPSELCKVTLAVYMADWLSRKGQRVREFGYGLLPFLIVLVIISALVMKQPDMGTALVIIGTAVAIFFVAGANLLQLVPMGLLGLVGLAGLALMSPYRSGRITTFLNPWAHPQGSGYHVIQSLIALGAGGVRGLGLGDSRQKFGLLPFPYTDSIFAIIGEELGLIGACVVLLLFLLLAYRGFRAARRAPDTFGSLLAVGISFQMALQAFLNIAVVTSTVPFTGITLPFVSYGGSSMVVSFAAMGILLNITTYSEERTGEPIAQEEAEVAAERRRHWRARLPGARRRSGRPRAALARG